MCDMPESSLGYLMTYCVSDRSEPVGTVEPKLQPKKVMIDMRHSPLLCNAHEGVTQLRNPLKATGQLKARHAPQHQASHCTWHHAQLAGNLRTNLSFNKLHQCLQFIM